VSDNTINWSSSNPKIATVSNFGKVTGKAEGKVTITAATADGSNLKISKTISIMHDVYAVSTPTTTIYLKKKTSYLLRTYVESRYKSRIKTPIKFKSSNPKVAKVNAKGKITAIKPGSVVITITAVNTKMKQKLQVNVTKSKKIQEDMPFIDSISKSSVGSWAYAHVGDVVATNVQPKFRSSNPKIVSIDKYGLMLFKKKGKVTIYATVGGKTAKMKVTSK
jgi:uncharacterized protein YjdB